MPPRSPRRGQRTRGPDGVLYRSVFEKDAAVLIRAAGYEPNYEVELLPYVTESIYVVDFAVYRLGAKRGGMYLETKGYMPAEDRKKILAFRRSNPDIDFRLVFQNPKSVINTRAKRRVTYGAWATGHGITWGTLEDLPKWLKERA